MKKLYIYESIDSITGCWHSDGGLVIVTGGDPVDAWAEDVRKLPKSEREGLRRDLPEPDRVIPVGDGEADAVYVFPDAGCC